MHLFFFPTKEQNYIPHLNWGVHDWEWVSEQRGTRSTSFATVSMQNCNLGAIFLTLIFVTTFISLHIATLTRLLLYTSPLLYIRYFIIFVIHIQHAYKTWYSPFSRFAWHKDRLFRLQCYYYYYYDVFHSSLVQWHWRLI